MNLFRLLSLLFQRFGFSSLSQSLKSSSQQMSSQPLFPAPHISQTAKLRKRNHHQHHGFRGWEGAVVNLMKPRAAAGKTRSIHSTYLQIIRGLMPMKRNDEWRPRRPRTGKARSRWPEPQKGISWVMIWKSSSSSESVIYLPWNSTRAEEVKVYWVRISLENPFVFHPFGIINASIQFITCFTFPSNRKLLLLLLYYRCICAIRTKCHFLCNF